MWDSILYWIERHRFALMIALGVHIGVFAWTVTDFIEIPSPVEFEELALDMVPEEEEEEFIPLQMDPSQFDPSQSFQDVDVAVTGSGDDRKVGDNYSSYASQSDIERRVRDYESKFIKEAQSDNPEWDIPDLVDSKDIKSDYRNEGGDGKDGKSENASAKIYLPGRDNTNKCARSPNPVYESRTSGVVRVRVKVDRAGNVKETAYDPSGSSRATPALVELAEKRAYDAKFCVKTTAPLLQSGYVTFVFVARK